MNKTIKELEKSRLEKHKQYKKLYAEYVELVTKANDIYPQLMEMQNELLRFISTLLKIEEETHER